MVSRRGSEARPCRRGRRCRREHRHAARTTRDSSAAALRLSIIAAERRLADDDKVQINETEDELNKYASTEHQKEARIEDVEFDDKEKFRSGGIRLYYESYTPTLEGLKDGILLEAGFDTVTPNSPIDISSWIWEHLISIGVHINYINNTATGVQCYHPGYTLVEKLQTIVRKYRNKDNPGASDDKNFMRQYYDVYCLLGNSDIQAFIGTPEYVAHKAARIKGADNKIPLREHPALLLSDLETRESFQNRYQSTSKLYYNGQPEFEKILARIQLYLYRL